MQNTKTEI